MFATIRATTEDVRSARQLKGGGSLQGAVALVDQIQVAFELAHAALLGEVI